jgi:hypothetical protein
MGNHQEMRRIAVVALVMTVTACVGEPAERVGHVVRDSAGVRIVESTWPEFGDSVAWSIDPDPVIDLTRGPDAPNLFYRVSDVTMLPDGTVLVAEMGSARVRHFSRDGELLAESGREGDGPGEYRQLSSVQQYRSDSIVAFDRWLGRATVLNRDLEMARTIQFPAPYAAGLSVLDDGTFVVQFAFPSVIEYEGDGGVNRTPVPVLRYSPEGELIDTLLDLPGDEELMIPSRSGQGWASAVLLFPRRSFLAASGGKIVAASSDAMSFDVLSPGGGLLARAAVPTWDLSVSSEMIEAEKYAFVPEDASPELLQRVEERFAMQPLPKSRPAFEALRVDGRGYAWLAQTKGRSNYYEATRWEVFAPTGEWLGAIVTPARFIVHEFRAEHVLGVWLDTLDVEHPQVLRVYRRDAP